MHPRQSSNIIRREEISKEMSVIQKFNYYCDAWMMSKTFNLFTIKSHLAHISHSFPHYSKNPTECHFLGVYSIGYSLGCGFSFNLDR